MEEFYVDLGRQIRAHRTKQGFTQAEMAGRLRLNRTTFVNIEQGRQRLAVHQLVQLADVLGCEPSDLLPNNNGVSASPEEFLEDMRAKAFNTEGASSGGT